MIIEHDAVASVRNQKSISKPKTKRQQPFQYSIRLYTELESKSILKNKSMSVFSSLNLVFAIAFFPHDVSWCCRRVDIEREQKNEREKIKNRRCKWKKTFHQPPDSHWYDARRLSESKRRWKSQTSSSHQACSCWWKQTE